LANAAAQNAELTRQHAEAAEALAGAYMEQRV